MPSIQEITTDQLARELQDNAWVIVDVREPDEHQTGVIPSAYLIPLGSLPASLKEIPKERPLALVCRSGQRSLRAAEYLAQFGYECVNVAGGMLKWTGPVVIPEL